MVWKNPDRSWIFFDKHGASAFLSFVRRTVNGRSLHFLGIYYNLTRDIEDLPPSLLAGIKGICAGLFNVLLAIMMHQKCSDINGIAFTFVIESLVTG